ncbi:twitching motility protein PilT [Methylobacterium sp. Leaf456]|uniref:type II toxin-antitoxin system VapC family toxin n=1 Tax=Methylobacterium sp. Leaf456 TaxID=1736382 RepID=UPI0006F236C0|nr:type II toxin-antitoxin system VapC family toxin [Methylobacterium sp. Leaf456]KQT57680.1 twitching motility protein PilT [Methylobacterium sp. Leaf456]
MYLIDTNVLSAGAPTRPVPAQDVTAWMDRNSAGLFLSVVTVAEIEDGIAKCRREGASRKAGRLADWLEALLHLYANRILPIDLDTARLVGALTDRARRQGHDPGWADLAIAATTGRHGFTLLTRNLRHFHPLGVKALDPFAALPPETV